MSRKNSILRHVFCMYCLLQATTSCNGTDAKVESNVNVIEPWIGEGQFSILVDTIHQWEGRPDFILDEYEFRYCHSQSTNRLFANLTKHNFKYRQIREGKLDYNLLKQHDVLFINVPTKIKGGRSAPDRKFPVIRDDEIRNIVRFVEEGGGLFVVSEHNNAYDNATVLNKLLKYFDVQIPSSYARDKELSKNTIGKTSILIRISNYKEHPITRKVRETSWLGGGPIDTKDGVAFLSEHGHSDLGNYITHKPSKHSNRKVDEGEITGSEIPLFAAVEKGKGRVVVIGDHNTLGVQWLGIADNYRFAANSFAWLAGRENEEPHIADAPPIGIKLGWDLSHSDWNPGLRDRRGFHPAFINFSREPRLFTMGLLALDDPADIILLADPEDEFSSKDLDIIKTRLSKGQRVIIFADPAQPQKGTVQLLQTFLPDLEFKTPDGIITPATMKIAIGKRNQVSKISQALPIFSSELDISDNLIAGALDLHKAGKSRYSYPRNLKESTPYLLDIFTRQSAPLIWAQAPDGHEITIARRFAVNGGEIVLFVQAKMWGNDTFGKMRDEPEIDVSYGSHDLQLAFAKWLADLHPIISEEKGKLEPVVVFEANVDGGVDASIEASLN